MSCTNCNTQGLTQPVYQCWSFIMTVTISVLVITVSICGLAGLFKPFSNDSTFYCTLITMIASLWFPRPSISQGTNLNSLIRNTDKITSEPKIYIDSEKI